MTQTIDTFAMAAGVAAARRAELTRKADDWLLGWFHRGDAQRFVPAMDALMAAWQARIASGQFASTRELLADILKNGSADAKQGLAFLATGEAHADVGDIGQLLSDEARSVIRHSLVAHGQDLVASREHKPRLLLGDLVAVEEAEEPRRAGEFASSFSRIELASGNEGKVEVYAALAALKQTTSPLTATAAALEDEFIRDPGVGRQLVRFAQGLADPVTMSLMVAGFFTAHLTTAAAMGLVGRTMIGRLAFAVPLVPAATGIAIESGAFVLAERALREGLTADEVDWRGGQILRDWGSLAMAFTAMRLMGVPLQLIDAKAAQAAWLGDAGKLALGVGANAAQAGAFTLGGLASYATGLREDEPRFLSEWLMLLQFQLGVKAANLATGNWAMRQAAELRALPPLDPAVQRKLERFATKLALAPLMPFGVMATLTPEQIARCSPDVQKRYKDLEAKENRLKDIPALEDYLKEVRREKDELEQSVLERLKREDDAEADAKAELYMRETELKDAQLPPAEREMKWLQGIYINNEPARERASSSAFGTKRELVKDSFVKARLRELVDSPDTYSAKYGWAKSMYALNVEVNRQTREKEREEAVIEREASLLAGISERMDSEVDDNYYPNAADDRLSELRADPEAYHNKYGWAESERDLDRSLRLFGCSITLID